MPTDTFLRSGLLASLHGRVPVTPRHVRAGEVVYRAGTPFNILFAVTAGALKTTRHCLDGRDRLASLHLAPDWLGFDGIVDNSYAWQATALTDADLACINYQELLNAARTAPALLQQLHAEMGHEMARHRELAISWRRLAVNERVGRFLLDWIVRSRAGEDPGGEVTVSLPLSRAEIGDLLGMTVESVSRALSHLVHEGVISFADTARRSIHVPDPKALRSVYLTHA